MMCERCGKNEANVHITKNINGQITEMNLCSECANKSGDMISFNGMFRDFFSSIMPARARRYDYRIPVEFNEYAGCEDCIEESAQTIQPAEEKKDDNEKRIAELRRQISDAVEKEVQMKVKRTFQIGNSMMQ